MTTLLHQTLAQESIYIPTPARVVSVSPVTHQDALLKISLPNNFSLNHQPGQFVELSLLGIGEAPISVTSSPSRSNGTFDLCVRRVGKLTDAVHRLKGGALVGIRGPFGRPFPVERYRGKDILFIAGGLGLAPLRSLINEVMDRPGQFGDVTILYGARSKGDLLFTDDLELWGKTADVRVTVDYASPGWDGHVGVVTTLFESLDIQPRNMVAVVVGPPVIYKFVLKELLPRGIAPGNIWMSFERQMKCAVGKCGHCQMHHIYTCQDGPVFSYLEIRDLEEALA